MQRAHDPEINAFNLGRGRGGTAAGLDNCQWGAVGCYTDLGQSLNHPASKHAWRVFFWKVQTNPVEYV